MGSPERPVAVTSRLDSLTSLRAVAALMIFNIHIGFVFARTQLDALPQLFGAGRAALSFFFILSGFVLTWGYSARLSTGGFLRRRFARIVPLVVLTWVLGIGVSMLDDRPVPWAGALLSLLLLQSWHPNEAVFFAVNGVSWTLSCEFFFYFLLAPTRHRWIVLGRRARRLGIVALGAAVILAAALISADLPSQAPGQSGPSYSDAYWLATIFPPTRALEFFLGVLLARELRAGHMPRIRLDIAVLASVAALVACLWLPFRFTDTAATVVPLCMLIVAAAQSDLETSGHRSLLRNPLLVRLGELTLAFYLVHALVTRSVLVGWGSVGGALLQRFGALASIGAWTGALLVAIGLALFVHKYVEVPLEQRLRGKPYVARRSVVRGTNALGG